MPDLGGASCGHDRDGLTGRTTIEDPVGRLSANVIRAYELAKQQRERRQEFAAETT